MTDSPLTASRTLIEPSAFSTPGISRRAYLGSAVAGLAAPLLQACGGGSSGSGTPIALADRESVRWCREAIQAALGRPQSATTAVSVALFDEDRVVWREAFGYANRDTGQLATPDTRVYIGSVAKVIATLVVMILRDRGQLALDQPLVELLPGFTMLAPGYERVTVRHLVSHSSGFPGTNMHNAFMFVPYLDYAQDTLQELANSHLKHEPGELAVYCNDGFTMVEPLVRALTGLPFYEFVQREIFAPLGMNLSGYPVTPAAEGTYVHPYAEGRSLPQEMPAPYATGGVLTTPTDMLKLAQMFLDQGVYQGRRIVSADAVREMGVEQGARTRINPSASSWRWGLGWDSVRQPGLDAAGLLAWNKNGGTAFFNADFFVLPEARLAMLISGNGFDYGMRQLAEGLLLRAAQERGATKTLPPAIAGAVPPAASPAPDLDVLTGVYANYTAPFQVLAAADGSLTLRRWSEAGWTLVQANLRARTDGRWWTDGQTSTCYRFQTVEGHLYLITRTLSANALYWGEGPLGERLLPLDTPLPPAWRARVGSQWRLVNESPDSTVSRLHSPVIYRMGELAERPGYVMLNNEQLLRVVSDNEAGMTVKIPGNEGRDLYELFMVTVDGQEEMHTGTTVWQRVAA